MVPILSIPEGFPCLPIGNIKAKDQALGRIRDTQQLSYAAQAFQPVVKFRARQYYSLFNLESVCGPDGPGGDPPGRALGERKKNNGFSSRPDHQCI
jgi:hypothetical protein